jgi:hypothetical protein
MFSRQREEEFLAKVQAIQTSLNELETLVSKVRLTEHAEQRIADFIQTLRAHLHSYEANARKNLR